MATQDEIMTFLGHIKELYPSFRVNAAMAEYWIRNFITFRRESLYSAIDDCIKTERIAPTLADIYQRCVRLEGQPSRKKAAVAWGPKLLPEHSKHTREYHETRLGKIPVIFWVPDKYAINFNGQQMKKIDFCLEHLGAAKVEAILRNELSVTIEKVKRLKVDSKKYMGMLDQMTELCLADLAEG